MKFIIDLCGSFNPVLILTLGLATAFFFFYTTLHNINEGRKATKGRNLSGFLKTTGVIVDYGTIEETMIVKEGEIKRRKTVEHKVPVVQYTFNGETKTMTYKTYFFKDTPVNMGYEVTMYIDEKTGTPLIKYDDIYCNEIRDTEKTTYIVCGIIGVLTIMAMIFSIIANFS